MKQIIKKKESEDDSLFGLLASYKNLYSYFLVLELPQDLIVIIIAKNPSSFDELIKSKYQQFQPVRRIKMGVSRLFIKYISPEYIIKFYGPSLGLKIPENKVTVINNLENGYFILEVPYQYKEQVIQCIKRIITLTPQKKYEIIEKSLAEQEVEL
ncbi:MAG: hypothetical protein N3F66_03200 [Spirochaetes bacterium]|nr:hypothetical protein [Spirochaetota bacterium]